MPKLKGEIHHHELLPLDTKKIQAKPRAHKRYNLRPYCKLTIPFNCDWSLKKSSKRVTTANKKNNVQGKNALNYINSVEAIQKCIFTSNVKLINKLLNLSHANKTISDQLRQFIHQPDNLDQCLFLQSRKLTHYIIKKVDECKSFKNIFLDRLKDVNKLKSFLSNLSHLEWLRKKIEGKKELCINLIEALENDSRTKAKKVLCKLKHKNDKKENTIDVNNLPADHILIIEKKLLKYLGIENLNELVEKVENGEQFKKIETLESDSRNSNRIESIQKVPSQNSVEIQEKCLIKDRIYPCFFEAPSAEVSLNQVGKLFVEVNELLNL